MFTPQGNNLRVSRKYNGPFGDIVIDPPNDSQSVRTKASAPIKRSLSNRRLESPNTCLLPMRMGHHSKSFSQKPEVSTSSPNLESSEGRHLGTAPILPVLRLSRETRQTPRRSKLLLPGIPGNLSKSQRRKLRRIPSSSYDFSHSPMGESSDVRTRSLRKMSVPSRSFSQTFMPPRLESKENKTAIPKLTRSPSKLRLKPLRDGFILKRPGEKREKIEIVKSETECAKEERNTRKPYEKAEILHEEIEKFERGALLQRRKEMKAEYVRLRSLCAEGTDIENLVNDKF
eukprot:CAMPEP_0184494278 /NCGR_PEP_ID=MMETSP0113_2-20130426/28316_1 /TAXON_ID=91329 /ORGANISM="Norrisiella sphaerica, Strain BC52" /LENGTH=286 /DNA_ID=CAMNT_0026879977 /DNA_START=193 /DNA_END=1053 /DNA_ORIENTATION=+